MPDRNLRWVFNCPKCKAEITWQVELPLGKRQNAFAQNIECDKCSAYFVVKFEVPPQWQDIVLGGLVKARFVEQMEKAE